MLGPYLKSRCTRGTEISANTELITVETYVQQGETIWNHFFIYWPKCTKKCIFWAIWGPWGDLQWSDWACLAFQLSSHPYLCICQIRKQSDKKILGLNPKYEKNILFFIFGGSWGALTSNPGARKFQGSKTSSQNRHMYNKGKNNSQFFINGPQY